MTALSGGYISFNCSGPLAAKARCEYIKLYFFVAIVTHFEVVFQFGYTSDDHEVIHGLVMTKR